MPLQLVYRGYQTEPYQSQYAYALQLYAFLYPSVGPRWLILGESRARELFRRERECVMEVKVSAAISQRRLWSKS